MTTHPPRTADDAAADDAADDAATDAGGAVPGPNGRPASSTDGDGASDDGPDESTPPSAPGWWRRQGRRREERTVAGRRDRAFPVPLWRLVLESAPVVAFAVGFAAILYRLGDASFRTVPLYQDRSDARLIAAMVKTIHTEGWYLTNPNLAAPFGQQLYDFPHGGENLQLAIIRLLSGFTDGYAHTMNVYLIGGFGFLALVTFVVLRHLRFAYPIAAVGAVLYSFLPYHFFHEQSHLYRSTYFSAPLAGLLLLWAMAPRTAFQREPSPPGAHRQRHSRRRNIRWGRVATAVVLCAVVATTETMATAFTMTLLAAGGLVSAIRHRGWSYLLVPVAMVLVLVGVFAATNYPTLAHYRENGTNESAARRQVTEQERYGLKLSRVLIPPGDHRSDALGQFGTEAGENTPIRSEGGQYLGMIGVAGFLGAIYGAVARGVGRRRSERELFPGRATLLETSAMLTVLAVLFATVAGFAIVLSVAGFSQVRVWNRIVVLIAFFALLVVAIWFERFGRFVRRHLDRRIAIPVLGLIAVGVLAFGLWDQARPAGRDYDRYTAQVASDAEFVAEIADLLPDGSAIFQFPIIPFPEYSPPGRMLDYDHFRPYLQSDDSLSWSYGAIKGRPEADWQLAVRDDLRVDQSLPGLVGMGFNGIWVDTWAYEDDGVAVLTEVERLTATAPIFSSEGRFAFFDLTGYIDGLAASPAELADQAERLFDVTPPT